MNDVNELNLNLNLYCSGAATAQAKMTMEQFVYPLDFKLHSGHLNQIDLAQGKWHVLPGTNTVRTSTRVLAGWLLHITVNPNTVCPRDSWLVQQLVDCLEVEDLVAIGHLVQYITMDWPDSNPCTTILHMLEIVAASKGF